MDTGDIVLVPEKKTKLPMIVGVAVGAVLLVMLVVAICIGIVNAKKTERFAKFASFANYLVDGTDGTSFARQKYSDKGYYMLEKAIDDRDSAYFEKADKLFVVFWDGLKHKDGVVEEYRKNWEVVSAYGKLKLADNDKVSAYYAKNGAEETRMLAEDEVASLKAAGADELAEVQGEFVEAFVDRMELLKESGCLKGKKVVSGCKVNVSEMEVADERAQTAFNEKYEADRRVSKLARETVELSWEVKEELNK